MTPGYWMHETSGVLRPAVEAYLNGDAMTGAQIAAVRAYFRQWIENGDWIDAVDLRFSVDRVTTREAIAAWLDRAIAKGIDPL